MPSRKSSFDPVALMRLAFEQHQLMLSVWQTIWWRTASAMAGTLTAREFTSMWSEKPVAFAESARRSATAAMRGRPPEEIARQALRPLSTKSKSNARRLGRKKRF
jgi:hypothetical protein